MVLLSNCQFSSFLLQFPSQEASSAMLLNLLSLGDRSCISFEFLLILPLFQRGCQSLNRLHPNDFPAGIFNKWLQLSLHFEETHWLAFFFFFGPSKSGYECSSVCFHSARAFHASLYLLIPTSLLYPIISDVCSHCLLGDPVLPVAHTLWALVDHKPPRGGEMKLWDVLLLLIQWL